MGCFFVSEVAKSFAEVQTKKLENFMAPFNEQGSIVSTLQSHY